MSDDPSAPIDAPAEGPQDAGDGDGATASPGTDGLEPLEELPSERTLYVTGSALAPELPAAGSVTAPGSYQACFVQPPCDVLELVAAPVEAPLLITGVSVVARLWFEADAPVVSANTFDYGAWFGSTLGAPLSVVVTDGQPILPGAPKEVTLEMRFEDRLPIVIPAGEAVRLFVIAGTVHEGSGILKLLYGGETPSGVTFTAQNLTASALGAPGSESSETFTGTNLRGGFPLGGAEGETFQLHSFTVGANVSLLKVDLRQTGGVMPEADQDMDILDGTTVLSGSHLPFNEEHIYLAGPALEAILGKELTLRVGSFAGVNTEYEAMVTQA